MSEPAAGTGAELVQATFRTSDLQSAAAEAEIVAALQAAAGVQTVTVMHEEIHVIYDPLRTSEKELTAAIAATGHQPGTHDSERDSPFA